MPMGYQMRWLYYGPVLRAEGGLNSGPKYSGTASPSRGYDCVYTYRSGKRAKDLKQAGKYASNVLGSGSLYEKMLRRQAFLKEELGNVLAEGRPGNLSVFSGTDTGHPFATNKVWNSSIPFEYKLTTSTGKYKWNTLMYYQNYPHPVISDPLNVGVANGSAVISNSDYTWPLPMFTWVPRPAPVNQRVVTSSLNRALGTRLIASANPWAPKASLAQTILELIRGDVPTVLRNLRKHLADLQSLKQTLGSDWLNIQFGWTPLINDIKDSVEVLFKLHTLLYADNSNRRFRQGDLGVWSRTVDIVRSNTGYLYNGGTIHPSSGLQRPVVGRVTGDMTSLGSPGSINAAALIGGSAGVIVSADFRFAARYHSGAQPNSRELGFIERATELLGLESTPSTLWELTPWTWLLDWGSSLGSVAQNLSYLDWSNVLLDYAYLTTVVKTTTHAYANVRPYAISGTNVYEHSLSFIGTTTTTTEKVREQASPYGFSVSWDGLSAFQLSILAALGMSRGR